jgi:hypothetical protein
VQKVGWQAPDSRHATCRAWNRVRDAERLYHLGLYVPEPVRPPPSPNLASADLPRAAMRNGPSYASLPAAYYLLSASRVCNAVCTTSKSFSRCDRSWRQNFWKAVFVIRRKGDFKVPRKSKHVNDRQVRRVNSLRVTQGTTEIRQRVPVS